MFIYYKKWNNLDSQCSSSTSWIFKIKHFWFAWKVQDVLFKKLLKISPRDESLYRTRTNCCVSVGSTVWLIMTSVWISLMSRLSQYFCAFILVFMCAVLILSFWFKGMILSSFIHVVPNLSLCPFKKANGLQRSAPKVLQKTLMFHWREFGMTCGRVNQELSLSALRGLNLIFCISDAASDWVHDFLFLCYHFSYILQPNWSRGRKCCGDIYERSVSDSRPVICQGVSNPLDVSDGHEPSGILNSLQTRPYSVLDTLLDHLQCGDF